MSTEPRFWHRRVLHGLAMLVVLVGIAAQRSGGVWAAIPAPATLHSLQGVVTAGGSAAIGAVVVALQPGQSPATTSPVGPTGSYSLPLGDGDWSVAVTPPR